MLVLKTVHQIRLEIFSYAFTKLFPDISVLGYRVGKGLRGALWVSGSALKK